MAADTAAPQGAGMAYRHPLAFLLGFPGLALQRAYAGEFGAEFVEARLAEVRTVLAAWDAGELGDAEDRVGAVDTVAGYRGLAIFWHFRMPG